MRCIKCGGRVKCPRGITRETQKCGICRGVIKGAPKGTSRYGDNEGLLVR